MTATVVFAALVAASVVYSVCDSSRTRTYRQMDDYYRLERKRNYSFSDEQFTQNG